MELLTTILSSAGDYGLVIIQHLVRITTIFLFGLGSVYVPTRQLSLNIPKPKQHLISLVAMALASVVITGIYHYTTLPRFIWESIVFWIIGNVVYVILGHHFYKRMDNFLDKKIGSD